MDIPNLSQSTPSAKQSLSLSLIIIFIFTGIALGFWLSRLSPSGNDSISQVSDNQTETLSTDQISDSQQLKPGTVYGNTSKAFSDSANGVIEKGSINGEGTHILNRPGGPSQRASLTSSTVDLDLFIGKTVEVKGETNRSNKTSWLMDVGTIKIVE